MIRRASTSARPALTLVELLVVIGIITVLAVLGGIALSNWRNDQRTSGAVERLSQWLLIAKQRARRDGTPTGLRFVVTTEDGKTITREFQYVQYPEPIVGIPGQRTCNQIAPVPSGGTGGTANYSANFTGTDFVGSAKAGDVADYLVQPGDYLEVNGSTLYRILSVPSQNTLQLQRTLDSDMPHDDYRLDSAHATSNFRVHLQARPMLGEENLVMTAGMVVDLDAGRTLNLPIRAGNREIVFAPNGEVVGEGAGIGKILLWIHDTNAPAGDTTTSALIAVKVRTGFIASHPIAPGANPYQFTNDARSSGL